MSTVRISHSVRRAIPLRWWQAGKVAPIDCSTFTCAVGETTMPFTLAIEPVDLPNGQFRFAAPTLQQLALLHVGRTYGVQVLLRNALGEPIEEFRCTFEAV